MHAQWTADPQAFTITFISDGLTVGSVTGSAISGSTLVKPEYLLVKDGYTFLGWFDAPSGGTMYVWPHPLKPGNTTMYAQWWDNSQGPLTQYTITFNGNGGSVETPSITANAGTAISKPADPRGSAGYDFTGWFDTPNGGTPYTWPHTLTADVTMYAQWQDNSQGPLTQYTIAFDSHGGLVVEAITQNEGTQISQPADPTLPGYDFTGWFDAPSGGTLYAWPYTVTGNVTMHAQWRDSSLPPLTQYTITFDPHGGSDTPSITTDTGTAVDRPADPTRTGYTFLDWYSAASGGTPYTWPHTLTADVTMHAQWQALDTTPPAEVTGLRANIDDEAVTLAWTDPMDADLDRLEITWTGGSASTAKSAVYNRANSETITGLTNGTAYTFTVKTVDTSGNESQGETLTVTPADITSAVITIASTEDWTNTLDQIAANHDGTVSAPRVYTLDIPGFISVPGNGYIYGEYKTLRLTGSGTLRLSSAGNIISISDSTQTLIIDGPTLSGYGGNNTAVVNAGDGTLELRDGTISGNTSYEYHNPSHQRVYSPGGGVYVGSGTFIMSGGTITGNTSSFRQLGSSSASDSGSGGGVFVRNGTFIMSGGSITGNTAGRSVSVASSSSNGGGVCIAGSGTFTMSGGTISGNKAVAVSPGGTGTGSHSYGGGVYIVGSGTFTMSGGTINDNTASASHSFASSSNLGSHGGGVYAPTITMTGGAISGNTAEIGGGVKVSSSGTFTMDEGTISSNTSSRLGGGIYIDRGGIFTMNDGAISDNTSMFGGGVSFDSGTVTINGSFTMNDGIISGNTAEMDGGGVYIPGSYNSFTMTGGVISGNTANKYGMGGGVYAGAFTTGAFTMTGGVISGNTAGSLGGGAVVGNGFSKTGGGVIYGSDAADSSLKNTAGSGDTNGHAVYHRRGANQYYRDTTLDEEDDISAKATLPTGSAGSSLNNWTIGKML
jgi:uncharacterized repeat protein (TIGR02543 family)